MTGNAPIRAARMGDCRATLEHRGDGAMIVRNINPLGPYPRSVADRLDHWAAAAPDRVWLAERDAAGGWRRVTYAQARVKARNIAAGLLRRGLSAERPLVILSGNDIDHALLGMAALYAGVAYAPVSPAYSLISSDHGKLKHIFDLLTPGLVYVSDAAPYARALANAVPAGVEIVVGANPPPGRETTPFSALLAERGDAAVDAAHAATTHDTIAKFLFTSGSTGAPKAVVNTQRMLCSNMAMTTAHFAWLMDEPPVTLDWSPWNHTAGGNHDFNLILNNGGTLHIDDGKPTPGAIERTVRNLREVSPTWYFNVPKGYDALVPFLRADKALRESFFKNLKLMWYAGAGMAQHVWDALDELAAMTTGERVLVLTGLGSTETAPFALAADQTMIGAGVVGAPARDVVMKLVPAEGKHEVRLRGPLITPGYWRQPDLTAAAFDEEGFYRMGDALRFVDAGDVNKGFRFDGRIAEDFKLATGTWVAVGPMRASLIDALAPLAQDVALAGLDRDFVGALIFPDAGECAKLPGGAASAGAEIARRLAAHARQSTGSSTKVARAILLDEGPSIDKGEMTDKGSINQRAVLANRAALVERLYAEPPDAGVLRA